MTNSTEVLPDVLETPAVARPAPRALTLTAAADWRVAVLLFGALLSVYFLTASLQFLSTDELFIYDTVESFARRASVDLSETADITWPGETRVEPMQPLLAVPLFWLADRFQNVGNVHTVWLFNAFVTAFTGALLFLYVLRLGYSRSVALTVGLLFGLTTIAWPYSQNFFREPLAGLFLLLTAYGLLRWRQAMQGDYALPYRWLLVAIGAALAAILTKDAGLVALPVYVFILVPGNFWRRLDLMTWLRVVGLLALVGIVAVIGLYWYTTVLEAGIDRWDIFGRIQSALGNLGWVRFVATGFLLSPGKGIFWHSPIFLAALVAPWAASRERRVDVLWPLLVLGIFVVAYALNSTYIWFGGANWGARYLVPLTPLLMLSATPLVARAFEPPTGRFGWLPRVTIGLLALAGLLVQLGAVAVHPGDYALELDRTLPYGAAWNEAIWTVEHSEIIGHWALLLRGEVSIAWIAAFEQPDWLLGSMLSLTAITACVALAVAQRKHTASALQLLTSILVVSAMTILAAATLLVRVYPDQRYQGDNPALQQLRAELEDTDLPNPVIYLNNRTYFPFMLNYYKGDAVWYTLELNPNEQLIEGQSPPERRVDPRPLVNYNSWNYVDYFGRRYSTLLLVMETGPFDTNVLRPMEWWLNDAFYKISEQQFDPRIRLITFSATGAPPRGSDPDVALNWQVGDTMRVIGYSAVPSDRVVRPGSTLNITVWWEALDAPGADYSIGTYLITPQGTLAQQFDSYPLGGFWPTATWRAGDIIQNNVAFVLPPDLPPGFYEVWTVMYNPFSLERLEVTDATGTSVRDHIVLFTIEVTR